MSIESVYNDLKNKLLSIRKDIAVNPGSVTSDSFLTPPAYVLNKNRVLLDYVKGLQTLFTIQSLLNNEEALREIAEVELKTIDDVRNDLSNFIDKIGDNYRLSRFSAVSATGVVYMGRIDPPSQNITIPSGTQIRTLDNKIYKTTQEVIMTTPGTNLYDVESNLYVVAVPVKAEAEGSEGNTVSGTITEFINNISGLNYVFNKDNFTNGTDEETDTLFIQRIKTQLSGNNVGTINGYKRIILNNFRDVKDVIVVTAGDSLMERDVSSYGGFVDVWVLEETLPTTVTGTITEFNISVGGQDGYIFEKQPFNSLISSPANSLIVEDIDALSHSYADRTSIVFSSLPSLPFEVVYTYSALIQEIQEFLQQDEYAVLGNTVKRANAVEDMVLIKKAIRRNIDIVATITVLPNFNVNETISKTQDNILNYVSKLGLGEKLSQSDIIGVVENTTGVDSVNIPFDTFNFVEETTAQVNELQIERNEYIRIENININT